MNRKHIIAIIAAVISILFVLSCNCFAFSFNDDVNATEKVGVVPNVSVNFDSKLSVATLTITIPTNSNVYESKVCGGYITISWEKGVLSYSSTNNTSMFLNKTLSDTSTVLIDTKELSDSIVSVYIPQKTTNDFKFTMTLVMTFNVAEGISAGRKTAISVSGKAYTCGDNSREIDFEKTYNFAVCQHAKSSWHTTIESTCSEYGLLTQKCDICGTVLSTKQTPKTEHVYTHGPIERLFKYPSATEDGQGQYVCDVCGGVALIKLPSGYVYRVYNENGVYYAYNIDTDKLNLFEAVAEDEFDNYKMRYIVSEATEEDEGIALYVSENGDQIYMTYNLGEEFGKGKFVLTETVPPTCTEDGYNVYTNDVTGETYTETPDELKATGHKMTEWATAQEPTCTSGGLKTRYCTECRYSESEILPSLGGHKYELTEDIHPTCTEDGHKVYTCSQCGDSYTEEGEDLKALGHSWSEWQTIKEPNCVDNGYQERKCLRCGLTEQTVLPADASYHKWGSWQVVVAPTSLEDGYMERSCETCGEKEQIVMPATGYTYKVTKNADGTTTKVLEEEGIKLTYSSDKNGKLIVTMENNDGVVVIDGTSATDVYFLYWHLEGAEYREEVSEYAQLLSENGYGQVIDAVKFLMYIDKDYKTIEYANEIRIKIGEGYDNSILSVWYVSSEGLRMLKNDYVTKKDGIITISVAKGDKQTFDGGIEAGTPLIIVDTGKQVKNYTLPIVMIIVTVVLAVGIAVYVIVRKKMSADESENDDYE
ncbi:MAG: hypothetical protein K6F14_05410 [Clostridiales bacterium]|nr:hypothetical protein [Clostridiales bacterium]